MKLDPYLATALVAMFYGHIVPGDEVIVYPGPANYEIQNALTGSRYTIRPNETALFKRRFE